MQNEPRSLSWRDALETWLFVAANSFGGPAGQIAVMHRVLVDEKRWIGEERFLHALHFCMLLPGPEAMQLMTWQGWLAHGYRGGLAAGWMFVLPGFIAIFGLSNLYVVWHDAPAAAAGLLGLKAAVLAVVAEATVRIGRRVLGGVGPLLLAIGAFLALFLAQVPFPVVVAGAASLGFLLPRLFAPAPPPPVRAGSGEEPLLDEALRLGRLPWVQPSPRRDLAVAVAIALVWLAPTVALWAALGPDATPTRIATFFGQAALVTFGGAYSVLAWVAQRAVEVHHWLTAAEMLDGLGLAETTPGPLIQVVQFVGFLAAYRDPGPLDPRVAGALGSVLTTWVTFWPSFLFVFAGAPYLERIRSIPSLASALRAITSAVVGVIANLGVWLAIHVVFREVGELPLGPVSAPWPVWSSADPLAVVVAAASAVALLRFHVPMILVLMVAVVVGLAAFAVRWTWGVW